MQTYSTRRTTFLAIALTAIAAGPLACHNSPPPDQAIAELHDPDPDTRQRAADSLRTDEGVPPNAIQPLLDALGTERFLYVRGAILITLGKSGRPEAKAPIDQAVQSATDKDSRRWAGRALKYWMIATHALSADYAFPDGWPYGQPGYPRRLVE
ncbi:HEAT repeat domain-containing protein [Pendulispora rubella]|uniref:HEAT repeat domain-containing protein n=1 Tax=Pendulispora rubella TaxID=2741070 RepID=A0ABZ2KP22_9BACT